MGKTDSQSKLTDPPHGTKRGTGINAFVTGDVLHVIDDNEEIKITKHPHLNGLLRPPQMAYPLMASYTLSRKRIQIKEGLIQEFYPLISKGFIHQAMLWFKMGSSFSKRKQQPPPIYFLNTTPMMKRFK